MADPQDREPAQAAPQWPEPGAPAPAVKPPLGKLREAAPPTYSSLVDALSTIAWECDTGEHTEIARAALRAAAPSSGEPVADALRFVARELRDKGHVVEGADNCAMCHVLKAITDPIPCKHEAAAPSSAAAEPPSKEWLRRMADAEDEAGSISVGGLAVDAGLYRAEPVQDDALAWLEQCADDERRAAADARRYADWLESDEAVSVPSSAKFGDPDELRDDATAHDARAELYEAAAARLRTAPAAPPAAATGTGDEPT